MQIKSVMPKGSIAVPYAFCCGFGCGGGKV
jgi:hypothetical protein